MKDVTKFYEVESVKIHNVNMIEKYFNRDDVSEELHNMAMDETVSYGNMYIECRYNDMYNDEIVEHAADFMVELTAGTVTLVISLSYEWNNETALHVSFCDIDEVIPHDIDITKYL